MKKLLSVSALSLVVAACGGSNPPAAAPDGHGPHHEHGDHHGGGHHDEKGEHHDEGKLPPALKEFHDVLAPVWHMEKGPERVTKTCAESGKLRDKAAATKDEPLLAAATALVSECDKPGRPEFDAKFTAVHERFHALLK